MMTGCVLGRFKWTRVDAKVTSIRGTPTLSRDIRSLLLLNMLQVIESIAFGTSFKSKKVTTSCNKRARTKQTHSQITGSSPVVTQFTKTWTVQRLYSIMACRRRYGYLIDSDAVYLRSPIATISIWNMRNAYDNNSIVCCYCLCT